MSEVESPNPLRAAVLASGSGTNFQAMLSCESRGASWSTALLVSDRESAGALDRAKDAGVPTRVIPVGGRDAEEVADEVLEALQDTGIDVVFLAGYLRLVPGPVVRRYERRILNIHPALLPSFGGKGMYGRHVHEAVLAAGVRLTGPTVHFVDERYDEGSIVAQWPVPVLTADTADAIQRRVLAAEHLLYPLAADHVCRRIASGREPAPLPLPGDHFGMVEGPGGPDTPRGPGGSGDPGGSGGPGGMDGADGMDHPHGVRGLRTLFERRFGRR